MKRVRRSRRRRPLPHRTRESLEERARDDAASAGLRYVCDDDTPGFSRHKSGTGFCYRDENGAVIRDAATLRRLRSLAIPPAWTQVWICPFADGHIQATGRDLRGRKQYRYHAKWREHRDDDKFGRMVAFGDALPAVRARVERDLRKHGFPRDKVLALVVRLLEQTLIRVGNEEYARQNRSYGLTTLQNRHVVVDGQTMRFSFKGKSNKHHTIELRDRRLAGLVKELRALKGRDLFQYVADDGSLKSVSSDDVNAYIRDVAGAEFSAKDFRTWRGTVMAARALLSLEKATKKAINEAVRGVSEKLGNTLTVCRKSYVHPGVFRGHGDGSLQTVFSGEVVCVAGLDDDEARVLCFLRRPAPEPPPLLELLEQSVDAARKTATKKRAKRKAKAKRARRAATAAKKLAHELGEKVEEKVEEAVEQLEAKVEEAVAVVAGAAEERDVAALAAESAAESGAESGAGAADNVAALVVDKDDDDEAAEAA